MLPYILRRLAQSLLILLLVSFVGFAITLSAPGNALQTFIDPNVSVADLRAAEARLGLDQPVPVQYVHWMGQVLSGNLGYSIRTGRPVGAFIASRLGPTFTLMGTAFAITLALALWLGVLTAARPYSLLDYGVTGAAFARHQHPQLLLGHGAHLPVRPAAGLAAHLRPAQLRLGLQRLGHGGRPACGTWCCRCSSSC